MASISRSVQPDEELKNLRYRLRHSASHIMADAVLELFPEAKFAIGPPTEDGFYYDFDVSRPFTPEDLAEIEVLMRKRIQNDTPFIRSELALEEALEKFSNQPYKREIITEIPVGEPISVYQHGDFSDLCEGPHVHRTGEISAFKLLSIAGAYWRGSELNPMLQRIYGTAFETEAALEEYLKVLEEAERRDHRRLGRELDLYSIHDEIGPGLILWHPKGSRIRFLVEELWRNEHIEQGYELVHSPHIGRGRLWETSGHLSFYNENMYAPIDVDGQLYYAKPMNCPFHIMFYKTALRSYRDLPMRIGELGTVYRYERGGVLHGLLRVRGFTQDDAHIFCTPDQVEDEVKGVLSLTFHLMEIFQFHQYEVVLSTRPTKFVGDPDQWNRAEQALKRSLDTSGLQFAIDDGGGAFYGPKIDIKVRDAIGREWQLTTVQFDFNLPERFELSYTGEDGQDHRPYMVHRAIFGSLERFLGILIEHYAGSFPVWLAPIQAVVIPITDRHVEYANYVVEEFAKKGIRIELQNRGGRMQSRIRDAQLQKIPYMFVVGDREIESSSVSVRLRNGSDLGSQSVPFLCERLLSEIASKRDTE
ncbi:threonine--tRNA ligase [SAR202 cluster bacterium AD-802-E10_MRT_200m]|nr:threonine--tRNA ligase [SAR202 cluster bacterium AD-802-E10_MRT_200m]